MQLNILTPESKVFTGEADSIQLNGFDGKFEILNNHAPLIAILKEGTVKVKAKNETLTFQLKSGIVEVLKNNVSVLTEGVIEE
ncbi:MAG: ATP synthase F1 subunit epsilon [Chitinophagales bacterium]|nr:ATP synthase F1 subunit epsilon [Bacteroidota bacterium]